MGKSGTMQPVHGIWECSIILPWQHHLKCSCAIGYDSYQCSQLLQGAGIVYSYTWTEGNASYTHTLTIAFVI